MKIKILVRLLTKLVGCYARYFRKISGQVTLMRKTAVDGDSSDIVVSIYQQDLRFLYAFEQ